MGFVEWFLRHRGLPNFNSYPTEAYHGLELRTSMIVVALNGTKVRSADLWCP